MHNYNIFWALGLQKPVEIDFGGGGIPKNLAFTAAPWKIWLRLELWIVESDFKKSNKSRMIFIRFSDF